MKELIKETTLSYAELESIYKITNIVFTETNPDVVLKETLNILHKKLGLKRGIISIFNKKANEIYHDSYGFENPEDQVKFMPGEGITGKVIESGKPIALPRLDQEPLFLDKTGIRKRLNRSELTFICVPIKYKMETIGALSVDREIKSSEEDLSQEVFFLEKVAALVSEMLNKKRLQNENTRLREILQKSSPLGIIVGNSKQMREMAYQLSTIAPSEVTVLITGETGTGKELVAKEIHAQSNRNKKPFIVVNCGALPEGVIESELFGHKKGSFTGAIDNRVGKFEAANGGTLFLDEIGELPLMMQVKLLRVLQDREVTPIGENAPRKVDVRIIAATNRDLEEEIEKNNFRSDLFYRLNVFQIHLPPLRDRGADIILLSDHFVQKYAKQLGKNINRLDTPSIDMLMNYHWPGNVRELENCIERACLLTTDDTIHAHCLPPSLQMKSPSVRIDQKNTFETLVKIYEIELITDALKETKGNQRRASELLGTTKRVVQYKIDQYNIDYKRFREKK